mmetsp:Transcript_64338/g.178798  ORF Transcript_64338/g.178798 Transcript_64338/m.178798 type:complete len:941 (-) Transcript_64338:70-2892(-)
MCALVAAASVDQPSAARVHRSLPLPLRLYLSPRIPLERAAELRERALRQPRYAQISEVEDGALHVLPDFDLSEISSLERQRRRVIGLPLAERLLIDPTVLEKVQALPLFDLVLPSTATVSCGSGLAPDPRLRCARLVRWLGGRFSEDDLGADAGLLVAARVSLHPESKYQAALERQIPIVKPSYLEAVWQAQALNLVNIEAHKLPALAGLGICFDPLDAEVIARYRDYAVAAGAKIETMDRAEVLIVRDLLSLLCQEARKIGLRVAPPAWLERCLQLRACVPVSGELEVTAPRSLPLPPVGGPSRCLSASQSAPPVPSAPSELQVAAVAAGPDMRSEDGVLEGDCGLSLLGCVLCLLYLPSAQVRDAAKALAWRCGAFTTLDPQDQAITHVLFDVSACKGLVHVSMVVDEDRISFIDLSWLESCVQEGRKVSEHLHPKPKVVFNPTRDTARAAASVAPIQPTLAIVPAASHAGPLPLVVGPFSAAGVGPAVGSTAQPQVQPQPQPGPERAVPGVVRTLSMAEGGVFAGIALGLVGWPGGDAEATSLAEMISSQGGTALHGDGTADGALEAQVDVLVCRNFGPPPFATALPLATQYWVRACVQDGVRHSRTTYPHFEPGPGPLPIREMADCVVRLTALDVTKEGHAQRAYLQECATVLGAKVAKMDGRVGDLTHLVCAVPALLDRKLRESATRKQKTIVTVQWLLDCFRSNARQLEERYCIGAPSRPPPLLAGHDMLISPSALGSDGRLPKMAEELGASVHTWTSASELRTLLERGEASAVVSDANGAGVAEAGATTATVSTGSEANGGRRQVIVLLDEEEACGRAGEAAELESCIQLVRPEDRSTVFKQPAWLAETYRQHRRLPPEAFTALPKVAELEASASKKPRVDEPMYAWQSEASTLLQELAKNSRARELQSKAQKKVSEGLRLASLRREPSCVGG